jgi:hypothetical protein
MRAESVQTGPVRKKPSTSPYGANIDPKIKIGVKSAMKKSSEISKINKNVHN